MKRKILEKIGFFLLCILAGASLAACGGGGSSAVGSGALSISLTDSSTEAYQAIYVTIARVDVHHDGGDSWQTVAEPNKTYNLLELVNGALEPLGETTLAAGHYTQMRLILGETAEDSMNMLSMMHPHANYLIDSAGMPQEMKVPSGTNTGLKIVNGFDITENQITELILDFDAMRSVVRAGNGKYLLKPTIKVLEMASHAVVNGLVTELGSDPLVLLQGAFVSAQSLDPDNADVQERVSIEAGTLADENGEYSLFLRPGDYNLVATQDGYYADCAAVSLAEDGMATVDFDLPAVTASPGTISGTVTIANAAADQYATLDFRKGMICLGAQEESSITVKSLNIANDATYSASLPAGDYRVVASSPNNLSVAYNATVLVNSAVLVNVALP